MTMKHQTIVDTHRRPAAFHLICMWLEQLERPKTRRVGTDVKSAITLFEACYPGVKVSLEAMVSALIENGFTVKQTRTDRVMTNVSEHSLFRAMRGLRALDSPMSQDAHGKWTRDYIPPDAHWPARLARIDADCHPGLVQ